MKKLFLLFLNLSITMTACEQNPTDVIGDSDDTPTYDTKYDITTAEAMAENAVNHENSDDYSWNSGTTITITLNQETITASGAGVSINGSVATITSGGNYIISGTLNNGRIIVDSNDKATVRLILANANITCSTQAPISVASAEKTIIILADNSANFITDGSRYVFDNADDDEPNAAIFSKDNLSIFGNGALTIDAHYNDGIGSKDGLIIKSGTIHIDAVDDGIRGKDYLVIQDGNLTINAGGDALKSDNDDEANMGYILIEGGNINITSAADGFDAETDVLVTGGTLNLKTGGGSSVIPGDNSAKGIKGSKWVVLDGGTFYINASDDAIHSNARIVINAGVYSISTGDDAIHADSSLIINDGTIDITQSVEGVESYSVAVNGGKISVVASDDCFNSTAGTDTEGNDNSCTYLHGGYLVLNTSRGDGLDSNGSIVMTNGTVIIHGPSSAPEVMFDYNGTFKITGGLLISSGSYSNMTQAPSSSSTQNSLRIMFRAANSASTIFHVADSNGNNIVTFQPLHNYQSIVLSSSGLVKGKTYSVYLGGSSTGENTDGVFSAGTYSPGTKSTTFTVSGVITSISK